LKFNKYQGKTLLIFLIVFTLSVACNDISDEAPQGLVLVSDFSQGPQGWSPFFTNVPSSAVADYNLQINIAPIPISTGQSRNGLFISGSNKGSGLSFFLKKEITNLSPNKLYRLRFRIDVVTNISAIPADAANKSAQNESGINMLAGGLSFEPNIIGNSPLTGLLEANFNSQLSSKTGERSSDIINLGPLQHQKADNQFYQTQFDNIDAPFLARTNNNGTLWLLMGFQATKPENFEIYFSSVRVLFTEL